MLTMELFIKTEKLTLVQYFLIFLLLSPQYCHVPVSGSHIEFSWHIYLISPTLYDSFSVSPYYLWSKYFEETAQIFCKMFGNLDLCDVFPYLDSGYDVWEE